MSLLFIGWLASCSTDFEEEAEQAATDSREICFDLNADGGIALSSVRAAASLVGMQWKAYCFDDQYNYKFEQQGVLSGESEKVKITVAKGKVFRFLFLFAQKDIELPTLKEKDTYWSLAAYKPVLPLGDPMALLASKGGEDGTLRVATSSAVVQVSLLPRASRVVVEKAQEVSDAVTVDYIRFDKAAGAVTYAHVDPAYHAQCEALKEVPEVSYQVSFQEGGAAYMLPGFYAPGLGAEAVLGVTDEKGEKKEIAVAVPAGKALKAAAGKTYYVTLSQTGEGALAAVWTTRKVKKTLRLASQNLWGKKITDVIDHFYKMDVDVMCAQECGNFTDEEVKGYKLYVHSHSNNGQGRCSIISKYPFENVTPNKYGVYIDLGDGVKVLVMNCHGAFKPYGPYQLNGIDYGGFPATTDVNSVIELNKEARKDMVAKLLEDFKSATTEFVSISGDYNEPSWLDWTKATTEAGLSANVVQWPTTRALWEGGVKGDAYRTVHPDPVTHPGFTWSPKPGKVDTKDRIDLTLYNDTENTTVKSCKVVGESDSTSDVVISPWIFDHRGLITEFVYEQ